MRGPKSDPRNDTWTDPKKCPPDCRKWVKTICFRCVFARLASPKGDHIGTIWGPHGDHLRTSSRACLGHHMGHHLGPVWALYGPCLGHRIIWGSLSYLWCSVRKSPVFRRARPPKREYLENRPPKQEYLENRPSNAHIFVIMNIVIIIYDDLTINL